MSVEVKAVADVVQDIAKIKDKARVVAGELQSNIKDADEALEMTRSSISAPLKAVVAELRGLLGINTNNPPADQRIETESAGGREEA